MNVSTSTPVAKSAPARIRPRAPHLRFEDVGRYWFAGSRAATHISNGVNLLFPAGERFFVRSVRHYLDRISPELGAQVKGFCGQEGRHAQAHERLFETLRAQGFDIDSILRLYERIAYGLIERAASPSLRLSVTVALEHFTALMAEDALTFDALAEAEPEIRRLLEWHAVEELEHKAVAFDVLAAVAPSYWLRAAGMSIAAVTLAGFWLYASGELMKQDGSSLRESKKELEELRRLAKAEGDHRAAEPIGERIFVRGIREYLKPGFHPMQRDHSELIARTLARLAAEGVVDASAIAS